MIKDCWSVKGSPPLVWGPGLWNGEAECPSRTGDGILCGLHRLLLMHLFQGKSSKAQLMSFFYSAHCTWLAAVPAWVRQVATGDHNHFCHSTRVRFLSLQWEKHKGTPCVGQKHFSSNLSFPLPASEERNNFPLLLFVVYARAFSSQEMFKCRGETISCFRVRSYLFDRPHIPPMRKLLLLNWILNRHPIVDGLKWEPVSSKSCRSHLLEMWKRLSGRVAFSHTHTGVCT